MIDYISENRLKPYLAKTDNNNLDNALDLYNWNIKLSESLYSSLCYFEIILRNVCNVKLIKDFGIDWLYNNEILSGDNKIKGQWAIDEINKTEKKISINKSKITNNDIISNLELGFWVNLFCSNYTNTVWRKSLKYALNNINRKLLFQKLNDIRRLRNRIFHYEPIIFKFDLEYEYKQIIETIKILSNNSMVEKVKKVSKFKELFDEYKNTWTLH